MEAAAARRIAVPTTAARGKWAGGQMGRWEGGLDKGEGFDVLHLDPGYYLSSVDQLRISCERITGAHYACARACVMTTSRCLFYESLLDS